LAVASTPASATISAAKSWWTNSGASKARTAEMSLLAASTSRRKARRSPLGPCHQALAQSIQIRANSVPRPQALLCHRVVGILRLTTEVFVRQPRRCS
jgi:hypothetical protein